MINSAFFLLWFVFGRSFQYLLHATALFSEKMLAILARYGNRWIRTSNCHSWFCGDIRGLYHPKFLYNKGKGFYSILYIIWAWTIAEIRISYESFGEIRCSLLHEKAETFFSHTESTVFVRHSSEYETSDNNRKK